MVPPAALRGVRAYRLLRFLTLAAGTKHAREAGHPFLTSFEPGESWFWNIETDQYYEGPELAPPTAHPASQPTPGPRDKVPGDWERQLH